ncbi:GNAT family N-acetyltransferase [Flavobacterium sp. SUN046]|uniref:GNAT family N-acetyltransferase n=1 Tax=Flavobacterium sp. SUN046 TaxID=3002440 RepID=UPI002DB9F082|nr:GNAT family N-acetyltransferase [Flavobacterium sp. SUN046]MEC4048707.1 GNAT family N-acetyltransferase [Flavobacterium sp. SUN046]
MDLIITTERLILRQLLPSDAEAMFEMDRNPNVHKYLWNKPVETIEEITEIIENIRKQYLDNGIGRFAIVVKDTNEFVGWAGIKFITEPENGHVNFYDFGYRLNEKHWGKGYASEASYAWLAYGFNQMNIKIMYAAAHSDNGASNRILQKIGMTLKEHYLSDEIQWNWYEMFAPTTN